MPREYREPPRCAYCSSHRLSSPFYKGHKDCPYRCPEHLGVCPFCNDLKLKRVIQKELDKVSNQTQVEKRPKVLFCEFCCHHGKDSELYPGHKKDCEYREKCSPDCLICLYMDDLNKVNKRIQANRRARKPIYQPYLKQKICYPHIYPRDAQCQPIKGGVLETNFRERNRAG